MNRSIKTCRERRSWGGRWLRPMAITVSLLMSLVLAKRYWFS